MLEQVDLTATGPKKFKSFSLGMKQRLKDLEYGEKTENHGK